MTTTSPNRSTRPDEADVVEPAADSDETDAEEPTVEDEVRELLGEDETDDADPEA